MIRAHVHARFLRVVERARERAAGREADHFAALKAAGERERRQAKASRSKRRADESAGDDE